MLFNRRSHLLLTEENALPGRSEPITVSEPHFVLGTPLTPPFPEGIETVIVAMGCFWGAERAFWRVPGVYTTAVGYAGGFTANPTYEEVCTGRTGHTEAVLVAFDPAELPFEELLKVFWEQHDPTQLNRQGNDVGTQYRSAIFWTAEEQSAAVASSRDAYGERLRAAGHGDIVTEVGEAGPFYYAEDYHQQYLAKGLVRAGGIPRERLAAWYRDESPLHAMATEGYCSMRGTGVSCPIGVGVDLDGEGDGAEAAT